MDDIISNVLHQDSDLVTLTLRAHLAIEALLVELLLLADPQSKVLAWDLPKKKLEEHVNRAFFEKT